MVVINASARSALAVLQAIKPQPDAVRTGRPSSSSTVEPSKQVRMAPGISDAIMQIGKVARGTKLAELPAEHAERLRGYGADAAERVAKPVVSDEEFQSTVMAFLKASWSGSERAHLREAITSSTLKIQRANDVGIYETVQYNMFKDGSLIGGTGWGTFNQNLYDAQAAAGIRQGLGSVHGLDYYVTW